MIFDFTEKIIQKDDCSIHYWVNSDVPGSWLIFLHGAGTDHRTFDKQIEVLKNRFRILIWDARGHGLSRPMNGVFAAQLLLEDIISIMDKEDCEKATFIGHSMGGNLSQEVAFYHPERVESLVLIDCTCNTMEISKFEGFLVRLTPGILKLFPWNVLKKSSAKISTLRPEVFEYLMETFNMVGKDDFVMILSKMLKFIHVEKNYQIRRNFLLLCGEKDKTGNIKKLAAKWAEREQNCEFHWIPGASHCAHQDNYNEVNDRIVNFLNRVY